MFYKALVFEELCKSLTSTFLFCQPFTAFVVFNKHNFDAIFLGIFFGISAKNNNKARTHLCAQANKNNFLLKKTLQKYNNNRSKNNILST